VANTPPRHADGSGKFAIPWGLFPQMASVTTNPLSAFVAPSAPPPVALPTPPNAAAVQKAEPKPPRVQSAPPP
jgi:hypothetical protein